MLRISAVEALCSQPDQTDAFKSIVDGVLNSIPSNASSSDRVRSSTAHIYPFPKKRHATALANVGTTNGKFTASNLALLKRESRSTQESLPRCRAYASCFRINASIRA